MEKLVNLQLGNNRIEYIQNEISGLVSLQELNLAVSENQIERPSKVIGISSSSTANSRFLQFGADDSIIKFELNKLDIWDVKQSL